MKNDPTVKITKVWADSYDKYEDDSFSQVLECISSE